MLQVTWHWALCFLISLLAGVSMADGVEPSHCQHRIRAFKTTIRIPLDGDLLTWQGAETVILDARPLAGHPRRATVYALWDRQDLYLACDVHSSKLQASVRERDGDKLREDDGVEFLNDPLLHFTKEFLPDDFSYHINILNAVYDDRGTPSGQPDPQWNGNAQHVVRVLDDYHHVVQIAVPSEEIGIEPTEGRTVLGIDFGVNGRDPESGAYEYFDWCGLKYSTTRPASGNCSLQVRSISKVLSTATDI
jgi:Carbohydrate family 9 binding domain-like